MNISTIDMPQAERVEVSEDTLTAVLSDGRTISVPLKWYPRLAHAAAKERRNWRCTKGGIHWPDLNENLSVEALFAGRPRKEKQKSDKTKPPVLDESALVEGRLMEVNWACGTAELHFIPQRVVPLRFDPVLNDDMRRLATQHVECQGKTQLAMYQGRHPLARVNWACGTAELLMEVNWACGTAELHFIPQRVVPLRFDQRPRSLQRQ